MRVLILDETYRFPPLDGGARSLWDLQRSLAELGHEAIVSGDDSLLEGARWDVVMASRPILAARVAQRASRAASSHTVYLGHDLHHRRLAATDGVLPEHPRPVAVVAALERRCWMEYGLSVYPNQHEVAEVRAAGTNARWFPYFRIDESLHGHRPPGGQTPTPSQGTARLLFVGGSTHAPNVTGLRWFAEEILPVIPQARVVVVGRWEPSLRNPLEAAGVEFTGPLSDIELDDVRARADANIAPLTAGAGLKSKVIEALASGVPLIATSVAMAGITDPWLVAYPGDDATQWRAALSAIRADTPAAAKITAAASSYASTHHGTEAYLTAVRELVSPPAVDCPVAP